MDEQITILNKKVMEGRGYQVSPGIPWRRYFARGFDMQLAVAIIGTPIFFLSFIYFDQSSMIAETIYRRQLFWFIGMFSCVIYFFIEAEIIKLTGTTFGKFSLGVQVLTIQYDRNYSYLQLLKRDFLILLKGFGLNIPIVNIIALFISKQHVEKDDLGQASWDYGCNTLISYKKLTGLNILMIIINIIISISIMIVYFFILNEIFSGSLPQPDTVEILFY